jgi:diacylglycerol kinase family enzyme
MGMSLPSSSTAPLFILLNAGSGCGDSEAVRQVVDGVLGSAGRRYRIVTPERGAQIPLAARRAAEQACAQGGVVVAAGGDGTLNAVAQAAHDTGCPMGVLPLGTFNYFGRTHGIPLDVEEATRTLLTAKVHPVQVGLVNDRVFLVNASVGLYPELLEDRERFKTRYGRRRLVALAAAIVTLMRSRPQLRLRIELGGQVRDVRSSTLFVGNNRLQLEQVGIPHAPAVDHGRVAAVMLRPMSTWAMLGLILRGAMGTLGDAERVESFQFQHMTVTPWLPYGRRIKVAADGEVMLMHTPLEFRVSPRPLYLLKAEEVAHPDAAAGVAAGAGA